MRLTKSTQEKLQAILQDQGYLVRYEKGNFKGGYCIVQEQRTVVINKFHPVESKVQALAEVIRQLPLNMELLSEAHTSLVTKIKAEAS
ncbi:MAG: hypothetical protein AAF824_07770 [Bacteroidota bacterium]